MLKNLVLAALLSTSALVGFAQTPVKAAPAGSTPVTVAAPAAEAAKPAPAKKAKQVKKVKKAKAAKPAVAPASK